MKSYIKKKTLSLKGAKWTIQKKKAYVRDYGRCLICGCPLRTEEAHPHHIKWKSNGGGDELENIATVGFACHRAIHDLDVMIDGKRLSKKETADLLRGRIHV